MTNVVQHFMDQLMAQGVGAVLLAALGAAVTLTGLVVLVDGAVTSFRNRRVGRTKVQLRNVGKLTIEEQQASLEGMNEALEAFKRAQAADAEVRRG